jgi:hypothetical protein
MPFSFEGHHEPAQEISTRRSASGVRSNGIKGHSPSESSLHSPG